MVQALHNFSVGGGLGGAVVYKSSLVELTLARCAFFYYFALVT